MRKDFLVLTILTIIIVILIAVLLWPINKVENKNPQKNNNPAAQQQKTEGIKVDFPVANQEVSSPIKITGSVNNGGWSGFEGQVCTVQLLDYKGNKVAIGILKATTDWTKPPVSFESTLTFQTKIKGPMTLLFSNENPSGLPDKDKKFGLPVVIK